MTESRNVPQTFADYARERYLPDFKERFLPNSYRNRRKAFDLYWLPQLGTIPLRDLTPQHIEGAVTEIRAAGIAERHLDNLLKMLVASLNDAVRWGLLDQNPAATVRLPPPKPIDRTPVWTPVQVHQVIACSDGVWRVLWKLLVGTGMKIGEGRALRWGDVDWDVPAITVQRTFSRGDDGEYESPIRPREIRVGPSLVAALEEWRTSQAVGLWANDKPQYGTTYVLSRPDGTRLSEASCTGHWKQAVALAGVPHHSIRTLRDFAAIEQLAAGVPLKTVSERLGHSSMRMTADLYGYAQADPQRLAADVLDRLIAGNPEE